MRTSAILFFTFCCCAIASPAIAEISTPYQVDEKDQVLFGDSVEVNGHYGLENYVQEYVNGFTHLSFTYTHHGCCYASYPPVIYVVNGDPRTGPVAIKHIEYIYCYSFSLFNSSDWFLCDLTFDATGYTLTVKRSGTDELVNIHTEIGNLAEGDWVALANQYPSEPPSPYSMAFTPVPVMESEPPVSECCSSVVFLPGIKASRLESDGDILWPPTTWSDDVRQLALNGDGESVYPVRVDGIVNTFYGTAVYEDFSGFMDSLATIDGETGTSTIREWLPLAYDWRYSPEEILADGIETTEGTINILAKIEEVATNSFTGKVTIVAHSMGGLMGKAIIKALEDEGKADLLDAFIMVGTPQLGTPQSIGSLLHGEGEGIGGGFIVKRSEGRMIAQNMKSAFNLLPSSLYFDEIIDPVIVFDENSEFVAEWRNFWGNELNMYSKFKSFVTATDFPRAEPAEDDLLTPEVLRTDLMDYSNDFHNTFDSYSIPGNIRVVQVAGWGIPTIKGIKYIDEHGELGYSALKTREGDSTVVYSSAISQLNSEIYYFNIYNYNESLGTHVQHRDMLGAQPVLKIVQYLFHKDEISNIDYVYTEKPTTSDIDGQLIVSTHSPVVLGAYDSLGNFTGINPDQDLSRDVLTITEEIPNSYVLTFGDSQYIFLPKEGIYSFVFKGVGSGLVTVDIEDFFNDITTPISSYTDMSVATGTDAEFTVNAGAPQSTNINIDYDADGDVDSVVYSDGYEFSLRELLNLLKNQINRSDVDDKLREKLIKWIEKLEKHIDKLQNDRALVAKLSNLLKKVFKGGDNGQIAESDIEQIVLIIGELEGLL